MHLALRTCPIILEGFLWVKKSKNSLLQTPGIHNDPDMNCFKWLQDGGGEKKVVLALNLGYPSIALEQRNIKCMLSLYQGRARLHSPTWFITTVNSICEHRHTHNPWHLFYWRPSAAWMKIKLFEECFKHYPSVLTHKISRRKKTCLCQKTDHWHKLTFASSLFYSALLWHAS